MTDFASNSEKQKKKRKLGSAAEKRTSGEKKKTRVSYDEAGTVKIHSGEVEEKAVESQTWSNLDLILSLQNKNITIQRKVELSYDFVEKWENDDCESKEAVCVSRLLQFLNDWIQSVLIPKAKGKGRTYDDDENGIIMDIRCWTVFKFCLVESLSRSLSLSFSRYFLRSVVCASESALRLLKKKISPDVTDFGEEGFELYNNVLECSTLVFSMNKVVLSDNLDLWLSTVDSVLQLANWVLSDGTPSHRAYDFSMNFTCLVLDSFSKYLKIHPCRKNGFQDFVERLFESLLQLSGLLYLQDDSKKLAKAVDEVLSQGLFHNIHVDGFLNFGSTEQYVASSDAKRKEQNINFKSYHRHLFEKLEKVFGDKKVSLFGVSKLFQLLIQRAKIQRIASLPSKDAHLTPNNGNIKTDSSSDDVLSSIMSTDMRKSLFDVFAQIMEPLLLELSRYIDLEIEIGPMLLDIYRFLKCINSVVDVLVQEKVYSRTEDTSESACFEYLKKVYDTVMGFSPKVCHLWLLAYKDDASKHTITLISEELILTVGNLLEIDYKVTGDDLQRLWSMMFSLFAFGSGNGEKDTVSLPARVLSFSCQLLNLYCELRQVTGVIVSFCEALRCLGIDNYGVEFCRPLTCQLYARSISKLIGSQAFRSALVNAVKSIPEGQVSGCIHQLSEDISDSVEWIKASCLAAAKKDKNQFPSTAIDMEYFYLHLEVFGVGLSEIYSLVLESVSVTSGNSSLIGTSVEEEVMAVTRPVMSVLVSRRPNLLGFMVSFTGVTPNHENIASESLLQNLRGPANFICLFFFRLYLSCRCLYRQAISLVAPKVSRKFSKLMGDTVSAYSGRELLEINDWTSEGYFSWILQPSASLLSVIKFIRQDLLCDGVTASPALTYVLHVMAIHRLVDLNRQLKTSEYVQQSTAYRVQPRMNVEPDLISGCKTTSVESHISVLRKEALKLVDFLMRHLLLVTEEYSTLTEVQTVKRWDLVICSLNTKSLATAIWRILCQSIDVWSVHVAKKQLKKFLTTLIYTSLSRTFEHGSADTVNIPTISMELLRNTMFYEQKSIQRHLASRLCVVLQKSILALPNCSVNMNHESGASALLEVLTSLDKLVTNVFIKNALSSEVSSQMKQRSQLLSCERFLGLLCWMPLDYLLLKSFSGLASAVLDLERLAIANVSETCSAPYEWLSLLVACRRALKHIVMAACENTEGFSPFFLMTPDNSVAMLWFLKTISAMSHLSLALSKISVSKGREMFFTLLDHTSAIVLNLCKSQVHHILMDSKKITKEAFSLVISDEMDHSSDNDAWRNLVTMAETLKKETDKFDFSVSKVEGFNDNVAGCLDGMNLWMNNLSCHLACVHGFLWGLAPALATRNTSPYETKVEKDKASEVKVLSSMFSDFLNRSLLHILYEQSQWPGIVSHSGIDLSNALLRSTGSPLATSNLADFPDMHSYSTFDGFSTRQLLSEDDKHAAPIEESQQKHFNRSLLRSLLKDDYPEAAFLLRQLFLAASAGIRLNLHTSTSSTHLLSCVSQLVLTELISLDESLPPFTFIWLDGVLKYLEELGNHFSINKSNQMINDSYNKLIDLLLRVDGKCISFLGKRATLASHETESITKMLDSHTLFTTEHHPLKPRGWNEFKSRLRTSVIGFISNASEQHLFFVIQAIDRALVGVQEDSAVIYEVVTGSADGGRVSSKVAAGVDFLDLVLEHASGRRRLGVIQRHIQRLVAGLFNITWHLQSPHIFMEQSAIRQDYAGLDPDPGAVVLMCTEVLTRIFAKQALFRLSYGHAGQALRLPGALFQNFLHTNFDSCASDKKEASGIDGFTDVQTTISCVDRKFSIDLYAASCRLLSTVIKHYKEYALDTHQKTKSAQSIGVLEDSLSVLLYCLETVNSDLATNRYFSWQVEEGVRLATLLRRVYEEIRQQKDVFGQWIFLFLSHYIQVYSGFGPNKTGIRREVDEALKPGIYALIDACSGEDLQHLHTEFGEGPCRSTLARLRQDYESNFRYVGKV